MSRVRILSIDVDPVTMEEAVEHCLAFLEERAPHFVVTPNAEIAYNASKDPDLAAVINAADLVIPDGAGIVMAARLLGQPMPERVAGTDLATNLLAELNARGKGRIFLFGTRSEVVAEAARRIHLTYPGLKVVGYRDGFFKPEQVPEIVSFIRDCRPDVLFVALGSPRQEQWLHKYLPELGVRLGMGVGGTIDVWAGAVQRAPEWAQRSNLEWLFRIVKLGRFGRSLPPLIKFGMAVLWKRMRGG